MATELGVGRAPRRASSVWVRAAWRLLAPAAAGLALAWLALALAYAAPLAASYDVGAAPAPISRLHAGERAGDLTYAYSLGSSTLQLPAAGAGLFVVTIRMAGPQGALPLQAQVAAAGWSAPIGPVAAPRVYRILAPAGDDGGLALRLASETVQPPGDSREIGLLLDRVSVRSASPSAPGSGLSLGIAVCALLAWAALCLAGLPPAARIAGLAAAVAALGVAAWYGRGVAAAPLLWSGAALAWGALALALVRFGGTLARPALAICAALVAWRLGLWVVAASALAHQELLHGVARAISSHSGLERASGGAAYDVLIGAWAQWDSGWYGSIVSSGYGFSRVEPTNIVFFPLYPLLAGGLLPLTGDFAAAGVIVSHVALAGALALLYDLLARDFGEPAAARAIIALLLFPTSLYFGAVYTESLALLLLVAVVWALRRERWWLAGAAGALMALTRLPGVLTAALVALALLERDGWRPRLRPAYAAALLPGLGLGTFMLYQWAAFGEPLAFLIRPDHWRERMSGPWAQPLEIAAAVAAGQGPLVLMQGATWGLFLALTALALWRLPLLYGAATLLLLLPAYLTNKPASLPRYVLLAFPAFLLLGMLLERSWGRLLVAATLPPLLALATTLYVLGYWVA